MPNPIQNLFNNLDDIYFQLDLTGKILSISSSIQKILKVTPNELINMPLNTYCKDENDLNTFIKFLSKEQRCHNYPISLKNIDGNNLYVSINAYLNTDNPSNPFIQGIMHDATENRLAEKKLEKYTHIIQKSLKQSQESSLIKVEFLANTSHEIRTPLNGILGLCDYLLYENLADEHNLIIKDIKNCGETLKDVLNSILDFSELDAGYVTIENNTFSIPDLLNECINEIEGKAHQKQLSLKMEKMPTIQTIVEGDQKRIKQVLMHLLNNAIKFTPEGAITLCGFVDVINGTQMLNLQVADTGIGIPKEKQKLIFTPFVQADGSLSRHFEGAGLGLTIAYRLAQMMSGTIKIQSPNSEFNKTDNPGSIFSFTMPLNKVSTQIEQDIPQHALLIEKNSLSRMAIEALLYQLGIQVVSVQVDHDVSTNWKNQIIDFILIDEESYKINKCIVKQQRDQWYIKQKIYIPIYIMSNNKNNYTNIDSDAWLQKPINKKDLTNITNGSFTK